MYGMYGCFISVCVSILGEDVIISFLVKHLDFSSLPSCLARSSKSVLENHPFFVYTPGVYTCSHPFSNSHDWLDKSPMFKSENTPSNVCFSIVILVVCGELEEVVWIPHHFSATNVTLLLCKKKSDEKPVVYSSPNELFSIPTILYLYMGSTACK